MHAGVGETSRRPSPCLQEVSKIVNQPSAASQEKMWNYARKFAERSGTVFSPVEGVTEAVIMGLAHHVDVLGRPLCPCNFYPDRGQESKKRRWLCPCDEMQIYKYCHCLLFVREDGMPITQYLPEEHEGRQMYGEQADPTPDLGRAQRNASDDAIREWHGAAAGQD